MIKFSSYRYEICKNIISSCSKDEEPFDHPFIYIADAQGGSSAVIDCDGTFVATYYVYMSTKKIAEDVTVNYELVVGDGLQEGVDFRQVSPGSSIVFPSGVYERPIRIEWLNHMIEAGKNNTVKIVLKSNSKNFTIGFPGPDHLNSEYTITKQIPF